MAEDVLYVKNSFYLFFFSLMNGAETWRLFIQYKF